MSFFLSLLCNRGVIRKRNLISTRATCAPVPSGNSLIYWKRTNACDSGSYLYLYLWTYTRLLVLLGWVRRFVWVCVCVCVGNAPLHVPGKVGIVASVWVTKPYKNTSYVFPISMQICTESKLEIRNANQLYFKYVFSASQFQPQWIHDLFVKQDICMNLYRYGKVSYDLDTDSSTRDPVSYR